MYSSKHNSGQLDQVNKHRISQNIFVESKKGKSRSRAILTNDDTKVLITCGNATNAYGADQWLTTLTKNNTTV